MFDIVPIAQVESLAFFVQIDMAESENGLLRKDLTELFDLTSPLDKSVTITEVSSNADFLSVEKTIDDEI